MAHPADLNDFDPTPPPISPRWNDNNTLGEKLERALLRFVQSIILWGSGWATKFIVYTFDQSMKILRPGTERATKSMITALQANQDTPQWFRDALRSVENETGESAFILRAAVFYEGIRSIIFGGNAPMTRLAMYSADKTARSYLPDPGTLASFHRLGLVSETAFRDNMAKLGVADPLIPVILETTRNLPATGEVITGWLRGFYSDDQFTALLTRLGYDPKDHGLYKELAHIIPPVSDQIHFLVRDAYNDAISQKFGYDEDYPEQIDAIVKKLGLAPEDARRYWRSHWNLPSPTQAFEMLHRGVIDKQTMDELLKTADYPKFWREKLTAISYNNFTRVDIRRMVQSGVMTEDEAYRAYLDLGYDPDKAKKMTAFAVAGTSEQEKDLTRADVVGAYTDGITDRDTALNGLVKMGYDPEEAEQTMKRADYDIAKAERTDKINAAKERFIAGQIDAAQVTTELTAAGLKTSGIDRYLLAWKRQIENEVKTPALADLKRLYKKAVISADDMREVLTMQNYGAKYIEWFMMEADLDTQAEAE